MDALMKQAWGAGIPLAQLSQLQLEIEDEEELAQAIEQQMAYLITDPLRMDIAGMILKDVAERGWRQHLEGSGWNV